jgi:hypothetical protein
MCKCDKKDKPLKDAKGKKNILKNYKQRQNEFVTKNHQRKRVGESSKIYEMKRNEETMEQ